MELVVRLALLFSRLPKPAPSDLPVLLLAMANDAYLVSKSSLLVGYQSETFI